MTVTIKYEPVNTKVMFLSGTSSHLKVVEDVFGDFVSNNDITILQGMYKATNDIFYKEIIKVVEKYGEIRV